MIYNLFVAFAVMAVAFGNIHDRAFYEEKFFDWIKEHGVVAQSGSHFVQMLQNFADNDDLIATHNAGNASFKLGHNKFSHMGRAEWKEYVSKGLKRPESVKGPKFIHQAPSDASALPASVDWRNQGAVTAVKDQGQCGSCWAFSTVGALEGAYQIKNGKLNNYAEQHLVDCDNFKNSDNKGSDLGCHGGLMDSAFDWVKNNNGLCQTSSYPYTSGTTKEMGTCQDSSCGKDSGVTPKSFTDVQTNSDTALMSAIAQQPVSVAIEADQAAFQLYKSGVFTADCGTNLDHGVLAVGYGTDSSSGLDYYTVKNSWGSSWGDNGYILLQRGVSQKQGQCGILSGPPSYPNLS